MIIDIPEFDGVNDKLDALASRLTRMENKLDSLTVVPPPTQLKSQVMAVTYFRDLTLWNTILASKPPFVIINPANGDALAADSLYVAQVPRNKAAGVPTFIYSHTKYSTRPIAEVKAAISRQLGFYPLLEGVFVDTTSNRPEHVPYYQELCTWLRTLGMKICLNPGTKAPEALIQMCDYMMIVETDYLTYRASTRQPWELYPAYRHKLWHVAHGCPPADMPLIVAKMKADNAGLITVTDDIMPNPYNVLPTYFASLENLVEQA